ncbi:hypothetical protein BRD00_09175 [Halobacteriales archaeon QS_8_69_26]|nr:MAG: hypothetical protein BRD00_09175 [Halobacteriales archaeon QS_8_69_26]
MLDRLLGRAGLKERIAELEAELAEAREEVDRLEDRLDAEAGRRSAAQSGRQEAERRANRLEDRVAGLEGEIEHLRDPGTDLEFRDTATLSGDRTRAVLDRLASVEAGPEGALTAAVEDDLPAEVEDTFGRRARLVAEAAPCVAVTDDTGLVSAALSGPVRPDPFVAWGEGFDLDRSNYLPTGSFTLALVRADLFALGTYEGDERVDYRGFDSPVGGDHSKGGFSQARFERLRDEQVEAHLDRCREALDDRAVDPLYLVGDRGTVEALADEYDPAATDAVDATGDPEDALATAFRSFWASKLYLI